MRSLGPHSFVVHSAGPNHRAGCYPAEVPLIHSEVDWIGLRLADLDWRNSRCCSYHGERDLVPSWYRRSMPLALPLHRLAEEFKNRVAGWIERNPEGAARIVLWMEEQLELSDEGRAPADFIRSFVEVLIPVNWWPLTIGMQGQAQRVMSDTGICLVWVPPADVVELIACAKSKEERDEFLIESGASIMNSVDLVLAEATHPQLEATVAAGREAVAAQRAGLTKAAQSLAASVLGEVVEGHFGFDDFGYARRAFRGEPASDASPWSSRRAAVQEAILGAIIQSKYGSPEAGFNRHLSAHGVDPRQFREAHALEGLMLLAGAIRELHEIYRVAERGFGPSPRLDQYARGQLERRIEAAGAAAT